MLEKLAIVTALAAGTFVFAPTPQAEANCKSNWMKLGSTFEVVGPPIMHFACKTLEKDDDSEKAAAAAAMCLDQYNKAMTDIAAIAKVYNATAEAGNIGPRGLGTDHTYRGKLAVERAFIGQPIGSDEYTITFAGTGGAKNASYTMEICFVDPIDGSSVIKPVRKTFTHNKGKYKQTFTGVVGARPIVYLKTSRPGPKVHKYDLRVEEGDPPDFVDVSAQVRKNYERSKRRR